MRTVAPLTLACTTCARPIDDLDLGEPRYIADAGGAWVLRSPDSDVLLCTDCRGPDVSAMVTSAIRRETDIPERATLAVMRGYDPFWQAEGFSTAAFAGVLLDAHSWDIGNSLQPFAGIDIGGEPRYVVWFGVTLDVDAVPGLSLAFRWNWSAPDGPFRLDLPGAATVDLRLQDGREIARGLRLFRAFVARNNGGVLAYDPHVEIANIVTVIRSKAAPRDLRPPIARAVSRRIKRDVGIHFYGLRRDGDARGDGPTDPGNSFRAQLRRVERRTGMTWDDLLRLAADR